MADEPRRFFVPAGTLKTGDVTLSGDLAHRLARVLRLRRGDKVVLTEGGEREFEVELTDVSANAVVGVVTGDRPSPPEPAI